MPTPLSSKRNNPGRRGFERARTMWCSLANRDLADYTKLRQQRAEQGLLAAARGGRTLSGTRRRVVVDRRDERRDSALAKKRS